MGAFFIDSSHKPLSKTWFIAQIRECLQAIGLPQHQYAGHSFRIGAATTAALVGTEDSMIQMMRRWHSAAFLLYIKSSKEKIAALSARLRTQRQ